MQGLRWLDLTGREAFAVVGYAFAMPLISLSLRLAGYKRTRAWIDALCPPPSVAAPPTQDWGPLHRTALVVRRAGAWSLANTSCLRQALLLILLLRRRGLDPQLQFGVASDGTGMHMHAWVEIEGVSLGASHGRFRAFR